jgi:hypothetical protein
MNAREPLIAEMQVALDSWQTDVCRIVLGARQLQRGLVFVRELIADSTVTTVDLDELLGEIEFDERRNGLSKTLYGTTATAVLVERASRTTTYTVCATTSEHAASLIEALAAGHDPEPGRREHQPRVRTWNAGRRASGATRRIDCPAWADIEGNYPSALRRQLAVLFRLDRPAATGRLILFHGEPGTGKTTALRALMRQWAPWCATQYIADPDHLFADAGYIAEILTTPPHDPFGALGDNNTEGEARWRLVVAEDADGHLIAAGRASGSTGRLLNLADGVLGQGSNTLILLTTNEPINRLHPALVRPGRCLAKVEFTAFPPAEAGAWLGDGAVVDRPMTLAELYEQRGEIERLGTIDPELLLGQYL